MSRYIVPWMSGYPTTGRSADDARLDFCRYIEMHPNATGMIDPIYEQLQNNFYDSIDQRKFCIVANKNILGCIRHVIRVSDDADEHLEEFKHEYYTDYTAIPGDEFYFMIGYHNVNAYLAEYREFKENGLFL